MSTLRLKSRQVPKPSDAKRLPKAYAVALTYFFGAAALSVALLAHTIPPFNFAKFAGVLSMVLVAMLLHGLHLRNYPVKGVSGWVTDRVIWTTVFLGIVGMQLTGYALRSAPNPELAPLVVAPLLAVGLLTSGLLGPAKGILAVSLAGMAAALTQICAVELIVGGWITASIGAHAVNPLRQRNDLMRATYVTTGMFAILALSIALIHALPWREALLSSCWAALAGFVSVAVFWLCVVPFEKSFGVVSDWTLLDLINPEQPLLRELVINAPGTYAHSVMVGNLAEHAARNIGANALLCRAMAYYHDIGKTKRPEFFIENKTGENPHDRLTPALSAKIISAHVKDGLKMAEEHRLPPAVRDGIAEHHGTSLISYFYFLHKEAEKGKERTTAQIAREIGGKDPLIEQQFRYPGPRPRTKETAVLLLADRVEAITRSRPTGSPGRIRALVWEIVQDVREDGQLDDSELNFRDLQTIVDSFVSSLTALRHERIDYPGVNLDATEEESSSPGVESDKEESNHEGLESSDSENA